jgi:hypothetical protein
MTRIFLDTNAVSYFFTYPNMDTRDLKCARQALREKVSAGELVVVGSLNVLEEVMMASQSHPGQYRRMRKLLVSVLESRWLWPLDKRYREEVRGGGGLLPEGSRYVPRGTRRGLIKMLSQKGRVDNLQAQIRRDFDQFKSDEQQVRANVLADLKSRPEFERLSDKETNMAIREGMREWWAGVDRGEWARDLLRDAVSRGHFSQDPADWPDPHTASPSLWHFLSYRLARIYLNVGEGRRIARSDLYDAYHYSAAAYADVLVTDDRAFQDTCNLLEDRPFLLSSFEEFVSRLV